MAEKRDRHFRVCLFFTHFRPGCGIPAAGRHIAEAAVSDQHPHDAQVEPHLRDKHAYAHRHRPNGPDQQHPGQVPHRHQHGVFQVVAPGVFIPGHQREGEGHHHGGQLQGEHRQQLPQKRVVQPGHIQVEAAQGRHRQQNQPHRRGFFPVFAPGPEELPGNVAVLPGDELSQHLVQGGAGGPHGHHRQRAHQPQHIQNDQAPNPLHAPGKGPVGVKKRLQHRLFPLQ